MCICETLFRYLCQSRPCANIHACMQISQANILHEFCCQVRLAWDSLHPYMHVHDTHTSTYKCSRTLHENVTRNPTKHMHAMPHPRNDMPTKQLCLFMHYRQTQRFAPSCLARFSAPQILHKLRNYAGLDLKRCRLGLSTTCAAQQEKQKDRSLLGSLKWIYLQ
jgi:hypothetical protein